MKYYHHNSVNYQTRTTSDHITESSEISNRHLDVEQDANNRKPNDKGRNGNLTHRGVCSSETWSTNSESPTPTNSFAECPWVQESFWHGLLGDEHKQLLGTEEESSDLHSSDDDNEIDLDTIYQMNVEQREYYLKQFRSIPQDSNGLITGKVARIFFEKSRITVEELRHIWQLCDVTQDGALNLEEFTAAMHLVVLRRNNIPLPAALPVCLHPNVLQQIPIHEPPEEDLLHLNDDEEDDNTDNTITGISTTKGSYQTGSSFLRSSLVASIKNENGSNSPHVDIKSSLLSLLPTAPTKTTDKNFWTMEVPVNQWTKFSESPVLSVSSPSPKPVNFDMQRTAQAVVSDPQILHPVPLRVTPVVLEKKIITAGKIYNDDIQSLPLHISTSKEASINQDPIPITVIDDDSNSVCGVNIPQYCDIDSRSIQRLSVKKLSKKSFGDLPFPSDSCVDNEISGNIQQLSVITSKRDSPKLRPHRHVRSNSLDLNKYNLTTLKHEKSENEEISGRNSLPPKTFEVCDSPLVTEPQAAPLQSSNHISAFEIYRKPITPRSPKSPIQSTSLSLQSLALTSNPLPTSASPVNSGNCIISHKLTVPSNAKVY